ncbi:MAG: nucleoside deaminase [Chloroflexi bacterium]|nr:nucleoside deaminase [Chloroflexota bacterium]
MERPADATLAGLAQQVELLTPDPQYPHDTYVIEALREAIASAKEGNFGVGAVLVDPSGSIIERGRNRVFYPQFRSDLHAEMDLMTRVEKQAGSASRWPSGLALFSSLEPCPMCLTRLITSGVGKVYYAARDERGGMVSRLHLMPPEWQELAEGRQFGFADCSPHLRDLAWRVFETTVTVNDQRLKERAQQRHRPEG